MQFRKNTTRRDFLQAVSTGPSLALLAGGASQMQAASADKFTPVELSSHFNVSLPTLVDVFGASSGESLAGIPTGSQKFRGIPFLLGPGGGTKSWLLLREHIAEVPLARHKAGYVCLAQFCDRFEADFVKKDEEDLDPLGARLADAVLVYTDGSEEVSPIRRRFEVSSPSISWGQLCFAALPHRPDLPSKLNDPLTQGTDWG